MDSLLQTEMPDIKIFARGKVRDNYAVGDDRLLMVASDRAVELLTRQGVLTIWAVCAVMGLYLLWSIWRSGRL